MSVLTIIHNGSTHYNGEVAHFSYESDDEGNVFVTASTKPVDTDPDNEPTAAPDPLNPDGRYSDAELAVIRRREARNAERPRDATA